MGNANCEGASEASRRCQACGLAGGCPCTAGLGGSCHQPCSSFNRSPYSMYQPTYDAWLQNNPRPAPLPPYTPVSITIGDMICAQCTQCVEFREIAAETITLDNLNQAMNCVNKMQQKIKEEKERQRAEEEARLKAEAEAKAAAEAAAAKTAAIKKGLIALIVILGVAGVGLVAVKMMKKKASSPSAPPGP